MEFQFDCECGESVSTFTRGDAHEINTRICCDECGAVYAVTITPIGTVDE